MPIPVLVTARLRLVPLAAGHLPALLDQWNDAEVGRFLWDGKPVSRGMADTVREASDLSFETGGYGLFCLEPLDARPAVVLGFCGLRVPEGGSSPEILYALARPAWGRGFAREAAEAVLDHAFSTLYLPEVVAGANPENPASWRILERLAFSRQGKVKTAVEELYTYVLTRERWLERRE